MGKKQENIIRANRARLRSEFNAQAEIGKFGKTGLARIALTPSYNRIRRLVQGWMEKAGLKTRVDAVGNLYGRKEGRIKGLPAVMAGSHLDSQNPGGRFDGAGGVLTALEAVRRIGESGAPHDHPIEVAAFIGEESASGMTVFGSSVATGIADAAALRACVHPPSGKSMYEAVRAAGGNPARLKSCLLRKKDLKCYLELHIEQGPILEANRTPIGVVDVVVSYIRGEIEFAGVTAHSGGQPMAYRQDAGMAAAAYMVEMEAIARRAPARQRITLTFGEIGFEPGWVTIVPGGARITFDLRARSKPALEAMLRRMRTTLARLSKKRRVKGRLRVIQKLPPCPASPGIRRAIARGAEAAGYKWMPLASGGVHDACCMAALCPMGMIFIPSVKGLSHTPEEFTRFADLAAGADVTIGALRRLADKRVRA